MEKEKQLITRMSNGSFGLNKETQTKKGLCSRCKKNKATIKYTDSYLSFAHGFIENICQECYDKMKEESPWYQQGRKDIIKNEIKFLKSMLQTKIGKKLSEARTQDTGRKTIPDMYDIKIKKRIKELEDVKKKER